MNTSSYIQEGRNCGLVEHNVYLTLLFQTWRQFRLCLVHMSWCEKLLADLSEQFSTLNVKTSRDDDTLNVKTSRDDDTEITIIIIIIMIIIIINHRLTTFQVKAREGANQAEQQALRENVMVLQN